MSMTVEGWNKRREPTVELYIKNRTRKVIRVKKLGPCLEWVGGKSGRPGWFEYKLKKGAASRCVWESMVGPIAKDKCILHKCDNRKCVEWKKHLYIGDRKQNRRDFMERHPRARELCLAAARAGAAGVKKFWDSMTPRQRQTFIRRRAAKQNLGG